MSRFSEAPSAFRRPLPHAVQMTAEEQATIATARQILSRHLNQNPILSSWQAVLDYAALTVRGEVERFHVLYLDRKNRLIADEEV
jgi:DNA repair protein RadC